MKLKYFFPALLAMAAMVVGCSEDDDPTYLDEIRVSSSYVSLDINGGSNSITVKTTSEWELKKIFTQTVKNGDQTETIQTALPAWLTASQVNGPAGESTIIFSADKTIDGRSAELILTSAGREQHINVIQGLSTVSEATCAEIIAGPDSKTYRVTGVCTAIANTNYGNFYLNDGTGQIYIYGTVDASGKYNWNSFGIEVGDEVTVEGPKTTYNGTVELVDATFISVNKSLIKVESTDPEDAVLPLEGGDIAVNLTCKTNYGVNVEIPEDAKGWLSISSIVGGANPVVTFHAAPNEGGDRSTKLVFKTTDGKKEYTAETTITQKGAIVAVTVEEFLDAEVGTVMYRLTGVITELYASDKQGKSFYIQDFSGKTLVYRAEGFIEAGAKVGDIVTVVGQRGAYKDSPQMVSGTFEEVKYAVTEVSIADFLTKEDSKEVFFDSIPQL